MRFLPVSLLLVMLVAVTLARSPIPPNFRPGIANKMASVCMLPKVVGKCRAKVGNLSRWYYDSKTRSCREFTYRGCGGNKNSFETKQACRCTCKPNAKNCTPKPAKKTTKKMVKPMRRPAKKMVSSLKGPAKKIIVSPMRMPARKRTQRVERAKMTKPMKRTAPKRGKRTKRAVKKIDSPAVRFSQAGY